MLRIFKENMQTWMETIEPVESIMQLIKVIRQQSFIDAKVMGLHKFH